MGRRIRLLAIRCSLLALILGCAGLFARTADAQSCNIVRMWVDPAWGHDNPQAATDDYINDASTSCRTLQFAVDHMNAYLRKQWNTTPGLEGIVYALPGLYGPHGTYSSGDVFPIWMQDRVHLQGAGARECVIRGGGTSTFGTFWPDPSLPPVGPQPIQKEVLIAYRDSSQFSRNVRGAANAPQMPLIPEHLAPWAGLKETSEMIDGFTFQGGDVQIYICPPYPVQAAPRDFPLAARVTNCVFDMRDQWAAAEQIDGTPPLSTYAMSGPTFGILMTKPYHDDGSVQGYFDQEVLVASNTFVLAEWRMGTGWIYIAPAEAVAVMDVVDANPIGGVGIPDPNLQLRGVGHPNIINNLFRTWPGQQPANTGHMAMLGIDRPDTRASDDAANPLDTNAFAASRVGSQNQTFQSTPVQSVQVGVVTASLAGTNFTFGPLFNCTSNPSSAPCAAIAPPVPAVVLWDGTSNASPQPYDPAFVGEYLTSVIGMPQDYRDWRLLPGSPLIDQGWYSEAMRFENGIVRFLPGTDCPEIESFDWDGEGYGNPRVVGDRIDIGCDEVHMLIMAGNYANDSTAHNDNLMGKSHLQPSAVTGMEKRQIITLPLFAGQTLRLNGTMSTPPLQPPALPAWSQPPVTLTPATRDGGALVDYNIRYISQGNPAPTPTPWTFSGLVLTPWPLSAGIGIPGQPLILNFVHVTILDLECQLGTCSNSYFNTQALVDFGGTNGRYRSNLQAEYR